MKPKNRTEQYLIDGFIADEVSRNIEAKHEAEIDLELCDFEREYSARHQEES